MSHVDPNRLVRGTYSIYHFTDKIYKVIKFKNTEIPIKIIDRTNETNHYDEKLEVSLSRTRRLVLEKALCNPWDWFCSFTLDKTKYDRFNLNKFYKDFSQFLRDQRKKSYEIKYLLIPEMHDNGAWHVHGFMHGMPELISFRDLRKAGHKVPDRLVYGNFYNWSAYQRKFGFCSFGPIRSPVRSSFYITKYITKDSSRLVSDLGSKVFRASQGLNSAQFHGEVYGQSDFLDQFLNAEYQYCSVGMTKVSDNQDWSFAMDESEFSDPFFRSASMLEPLFDSPTPGHFFDEMSRIQEVPEQLTYL